MRPLLLLLISWYLAFVDAEDDEEKDKFSPEPWQFAILVLVLITVLIIITIAFEIMKDMALEKAEKYTK
jgi:hypothetical protein